MIGEDDAGAGAPSRRQLTARGRAVSIANALRATRSTYRRARRMRFAIKTIILHSFGHVLGLIHEHQAPSAKSLVNMEGEIILQQAT